MLHYMDSLHSAALLTVQIIPPTDVGRSHSFVRPCLSQSLLFTGHISLMMLSDQGRAIFCVSSSYDILGFRLNDSFHLLE